MRMRLLGTARLAIAGDWASGDADGHGHVVTANAQEHEGRASRTAARGQARVLLHRGR